MPPTPFSGTSSDRWRWARAYFYSGWAFFIPYLAFYLLYAWLRWPVNPPSADSPPPSALRPPALLHIYWALHAAHLLLAALALRSWWQRLPDPSSSPSDPANRPPNTGYRLQTTALRPLSSVLRQAAPWALLALIFYIPGIYLEWPSDPWEHLRRINEWHTLDEVTDHSSWRKSSYLLPYSLTAYTTGPVQLSWLRFYYTAICLLFSWQYFRLARVVGLGESASFVFVVITALALGNNVFSFHRYYSLSSSIVAQLGAIALTRLTLEAVGVRRNPAQTGSWFIPHNLLTRSMTSGIVLLPLIAYNHPQGLGIAGLGILAVIAWRIVEWRDSMIAWLALVAATSSVAAVLWLTTHPAIGGAYLPLGWMGSWRGLNLLQPASPAVERMMQIIGNFGAINIIAALWLMRRNHLVGWLTLMPILALTLPSFALPMANMLANDPAGIPSFHRMFFAIPAGLAVVSVVKSFHAAAKCRHTPRWLRISRSTLLACGIALAVLALRDSHSSGRVWQSLQVVPEDLQLRQIVRSVSVPIADEKADVLRIDTQLSSDILETISPGRRYFVSRHSPVLAAPKYLAQRLDWLANAARNREVPGTALDHPRTISTPTTTADPWIVLGGHPPDYHLKAGNWSLANPRGMDSQIFNPEPIPISRTQRFLLKSRIRQDGNSATQSYLAVAWLDSTGRLLMSNVSEPNGAGEPLGWSNGTYSYYGGGALRGAFAAEHSITFGLGETAEVPSQAKFLRLGALLNYGSTAGAIVELSDVTLSEMPPHRGIVLESPDFQYQTTPASVSALLSGHWSPQHVSAAQAGAMELRAAFNLTVDR